MEDYSKLAVIGRGAFGTVYLCNNSSSEKCIMKEIVIEHLSKEDLEVTVQEVKLMSRLHHPHIIKYHNSFIDNGSLMIIMEFALRGTLHDFLQQQQTLLPQELCLALKYVHDQRILHRDITTSNILLTGHEGRVVKLSDFGLSKTLTSRSKASSVVGTPSYLSPELCEGKPYGTHSDVWALGCVLYNMCTLKPAFQAPTLGALVMKIMHGAIDPISATYDRGLSELLRLMLDREPLNRPTVAFILSHRLLAPVVCRIVTGRGIFYQLRPDKDQL